MEIVCFLRSPQSYPHYPHSVVHKLGITIFLLVLRPWYYGYGSDRRDRTGAGNKWSRPFGWPQSDISAFM